MRRALRLASSLLLLLLARPVRADDVPAREIIVCLKPASPAPTSIEAGFATRCAALGVRIDRRFDEGLLPASARSPRDARVRVDPGFDPSRVLLITAPDAASASAASAALAADPAVAWTAPNVVREPAAISIESPGTGRLGGVLFPNDPLFLDGRQWALQNVGPSGPYGGVPGADVHAPAAWALSVGSNQVVLGIADTGIDPGHPDLAASMPGGGTRIIRPFNAAGGFGVLDTYGHGTPVVGVFAARANNGVLFDSLGTAGLCGGDGASNLGCRIVPIKITHGDTGGATAFDISRAIVYAAQAGCRALNLSFGGETPSPLERIALHYAMQRGCVVVAAAGNHGFIDGDTPIYPAAYAVDGLCLQVGASDEWDTRPLFSSFGPGLDLVAPGVDIWTTFMTYPAASGGTHPGYVVAAGTSFAAPFVTGAVGLLAAARPDLDASDYGPILRATADDIGDPGPDPKTGFGRLNVATALTQVVGSIGLLHDEVAASDLLAQGEDSVRVENDAPPAALGFLGAHRATRWQASAVITLPDSIESAQVWPRIAGTSTVRGRSGSLTLTSWAEAVPLDDRRVLLRGTLYRLEDVTTDPPEDAWIPVPPDQARIGYTILGPVRRGAAAGPPSPAALRLSAAPNPFRQLTRLTGPAGAPFAIVDVTGRTIARAAFDPTGRFTWDGRDDAGRRSPPGLYFARCATTTGIRTARLVRIE